MKTIEADLTWTGERFERGIQVRCRGDTISHVGALGRKADLRLRERALLPGLVNAHSHAFQRALRGVGEGPGSFWSWREGMYSLAEGLDETAFRALCMDAFGEMREAGITTVGEFHYMHHLGATDDFRLDEVILGAAAEAGVRIVLLLAFYHAGGIGKALEPRQRRFRTNSRARYWRQVDHLSGLARVGAAVHSVRAASREELRDIAREAKCRDMVFHIHLEEQRREIEECVAAYGKRPMRFLLDEVEVDARVTAVHCTHTAPEEMDAYKARAGRVCLCPLTEANLGDGIADAARMGARCLGTDSNARISMLEEMRWLEYAQRLRREERGVIDPKALLEAATLEGARSLGIPAGRIAPDHWADLLAIDLAAPSLRGWTEETLLGGILLGSGDDVIADICVGGRWQARRIPP